MVAVCELCTPVYMLTLGPGCVSGKRVISGLTDLRREGERRTIRSKRFMSQTEKSRVINTASGSSKNPPGGAGRRSLPPDAVAEQMRKRLKKGPLMTSEVCFCGASGAPADEKQHTRTRSEQKNRLRLCLSTNKRSVTCRGEVLKCFFATAWCLCANFKCEMRAHSVWRRVSALVTSSCRERQTGATLRSTSPGQVSTRAHYLCPRESQNMGKIQSRHHESGAPRAGNWSGFAL